MLIQATPVMGPTGKNCTLTIISQAGGTAYYVVSGAAIPTPEKGSFAVSSYASLNIPSGAYAVTMSLRTPTGGATQMVQTTVTSPKVVVTYFLLSPRPPGPLLIVRNLG